MKHSMMRVAVAATLGFAALAANAGQIGVAIGNTYAAEYVTNAAAITVPATTYSITNLVNGTSTVYFHIRFSAGQVAGTPTANVYPANGGAAATIGAVTVDTDGLGYRVAVTAPAGGIPANSTVTFSGATLTGLASVLGAAQSVNASVYYTAVTGDNSAITTAQYVEPLTSATIMNASKVLTQKVRTSAVASPTYAAAETAKVDVGASLQQFTVGGLGSTTKVNLGSINFGLASGVVSPAGAAPSLADFGTATIQATGDFSSSNAATAVTLDSSVACAGGPGSITGTVSADKKTATFSGVVISSGVAPAPITANTYYLCYNIGTVVATTSPVIPAPVQYTLGDTAVLANATTTANSFTGSKVYNLQTNGAKTTVVGYAPVTGAVGTGYNTYLRVMNTGTLTADIYAAAYDPVTGKIGNKAIIAPQLAPSASLNVPASDLQVKLGMAAGTTTWTSILVTGATDSVAVQSLLINPQGIITNMSSYNNN